MVGISILSSLDVEVTTPISHPVIIFANTGINEWKEFFIQKKSEASDPSKKIAFDRCLKIIMWAEFCDATLTKVRNSRAENGFNIQFSFSFPTLALRAYFDRNLKKNITAVTVPANRNRTSV